MRLQEGWYSRGNPALCRMCRQQRGDDLRDRDAFDGEPFTRKFLTVTGEVNNPIILRVPVGTPVRECIKLAGGTPLSRYIVVNGGPMMGKMICMEDVPNSYVTKTMSGLIVLPEDSAIARRNQVTVKHMINQAKSACIQCSFCSQMCPRALLGHPIRPNKIMRKLSSGMPMEEMLNDPDARNAALCCECGICEIYACPMGLKPRTVNSMLKRNLRRQEFATRDRKVWNIWHSRSAR
ncbi:4Fe-4S dicluster domain-containing protein [Hungatella sp.]|uniref:4Fe-4S dicluster domain-containing protein n=1 Tax=Hungatella sp. TaxID=2613924 RepID=UPI0039925E4F